MYNTAVCDLPTIWASPTVSGLAMMWFFTLLQCWLPRRHGQLSASCLHLCPGLARTLPAKSQMPKAYTKRSNNYGLKSPMPTFVFFSLFFCILLNGKYTAHSWDRSTEKFLTLGAYGLQFCKPVTEALNTEHFKKNSEWSLVKCEELKVYNNFLVFCIYSSPSSPSS